MSTPKKSKTDVLNSGRRAYPTGRAVQSPTLQASPTLQSSLHTQLPLGSKERSRLKDHLLPRTVHGGDLTRGKRKTARPFNTKAPLHLVLKSTRAKGSWSMLHRRHRAKVQAMIYTYAARFKVRIYRASNVGNHLHLLVKAKDRKNLADFLRVLAGRVAVTITGAQKGVKKIGKFWDSLCWSRLVNWGRDFFQVRDYLVKNMTDQAYRHAQISTSEQPDTGNLFLNDPGWAEPG